MGFGKSATPQDRSYWLQDHVDNLERFVLARGLDRITLVMHDFGGPVGMGWPRGIRIASGGSCPRTGRRRSASPIWSNA